MSVKRMSVARYAVGERDIIEQGQPYVDHVEAMTAEGLHSKSDIAAELAHRDIRIASLAADLAKYQYPPEHRVSIAEARSKALEAALRDLLDDMGEDVNQRHHRDKYRVYQVSPQTMTAARAVLTPAPKGPYPNCRQPSVCRGTCPMDPSCGE